MLVVPFLAVVVSHSQVGRLDAVRERDIDANQIIRFLRANIRDGERILVYLTQRTPDLANRQHATRELYCHEQHIQTTHTLII